MHYRYSIQSIVVQYSAVQFNECSIVSYSRDCHLFACGEVFQGVCPRLGVVCRLGVSLRQVEHPCIAEVEVRLYLEQQPVSPLLQSPLMHA